ncbi:uncharacterized protein LOC116618497 [Nematostella vectensis]|uniref:uncharacterized protein LOC116618497 n=1 Tax=Nematostella vectensis TaxID=45351 RepID=UPI00207722A7|nr:uncharacterized protein LOC116618497 [Nematostella vectensis]
MYILTLVLFIAAAHADFAPIQEPIDVGQYEVVTSSRSARLNCGHIKLPLGCKIADDCSAKTCEIGFAGLNFKFSIKINKCESPLTVGVSVGVPNLGINFGHDFPTDQLVPIPNLIPSLGPLQFGAVFVMVKMHNSGSNLNLQVELQAGIAINNKPMFPIKFDLFNGNLPISTSDCNEGGGGLPPPPPGGACSDSNDFCKFMGSQCSNPEVASKCMLTCKQC